MGSTPLAKVAAFHIALALGLAAHAAPPPQATFEEAARLHREQRAAAAYARFIRAANDGHADAAEIAVFMHRYGTLLYRTQWDLHPDDVEDWRRRDRSATTVRQPLRGVRHGMAR